MKKYLLVSIMLLCISPTFQSCKLFQGIQVVSPFNAELVKDINALGMEIDLLYTTMEAQSDKSFDTYSSQYGSMEVLSNSIVARVESMPKSGLMITQAKSVQSVILEYKKTHQDKIKLNNSQINGNKIYLRGILKPLYVSAMAL